MNDGTTIRQELKIVVSLAQRQDEHGRPDIGPELWSVWRLVRFDEQFAGLNRLDRDGNFPLHDIGIVGQLPDRVPALAAFLARPCRGSPIETFQGDTKSMSPELSEQE